MTRLEKSILCHVVKIQNCVAVLENDNSVNVYVAQRQLAQEMQQQQGLLLHGDVLAEYQSKPPL